MIKMDLSCFTPMMPKDPKGKFRLDEEGFLGKEEAGSTSPGYPPTVGLKQPNGLFNRETTLSPVNFNNSAFQIML